MACIPEKEHRPIKPKVTSTARECYNRQWQTTTDCCNKNGNILDFSYKPFPVRLRSQRKCRQIRQKMNGICEKTDCFRISRERTPVRNFTISKCINTKCFFIKTFMNNYGRERKNPPCKGKKPIKSLKKQQFLLISFYRRYCKNGKEEEREKAFRFWLAAACCF